LVLDKFHLSKLTIKYSYFYLIFAVSGVQQSRPLQTRAAAVVAAAAVSAAAPKVICISPVSSAHRTHTVIRRAVNPACYRLHPQQQNRDVMRDEQKTGDGSGVPVTEADPAVAATSSSRPSSKRTFQQTLDHDFQLRLRAQLRSVANAKAAKIADVEAPSMVLPGSSVLLPGWSSKSADGRPQLRPLLPREIPPAGAMTNVITIVPTTGTSSVPLLCKKHAASSVMIPPTERPSAVPLSTPATAASSLTQTTSADCISTTLTETPSAGAGQCLERSSEATQVECRSTKDRQEPPGVSGNQLLQRIRLIECEMPAASNAQPTKASPFYINVVPLQASADDRPASQRPATVAMSPSCRPDAAADDDDQPPAEMLEALRLVRNPARSSRRDVIVTSSSPPADAKLDTAAASTSQQPQVPASASVSSAGTRLVTMKLVNRATQ